MNKEFSIYDSPFSDETKKIRRNLLLASGLCLFVGLTGELPEKFSLLGVSFTSAQQIILGWFMFAIALYLFLTLFLWLVLKPQNGFIHSMSGY